MKINESETIEVEKYRKIGLFKKPKKSLLHLLDLNHNEEILINLRLFPLRSIFINNIKEGYAMRLVLTTERIIFILNRGWILKEFITYDSINEILLTRKRINSSTFPEVMIKTSTNTYEILFTTLFPYRDKINGIVDCMKNRNPNINAGIDSEYHDNDDIIGLIKASIKDLLLIKIK